MGAMAPNRKKNKTKNQKTLFLLTELLLPHAGRCNVFFCIQSCEIERSGNSNCDSVPFPDAKRFLEVGRYGQLGEEMTNIREVSWKDQWSFSLPALKSLTGSAHQHLQPISVKQVKP